MLMGCKKCRMIGAVLFLALGVVFLLRDLGMWDFWNVQWWTALFLLAGVTGFAACNCPDCCAMMKKR